MSVCYRCRAVGAVGGLSQMSGAGHSPVGGGGGSVPVCVCALFMGHIGYISLKTKNIIFLSLFSFIIKVFAKPRNYKKNHSLFQLCTLRPRRLISVSLQAAAFSPSLGSFLRATPGRSCILEVHSGPPNLKVVPASIHAYIWIYRKQVMSAHLTLGVQAGIWRISRNKRRTSSSVPSLKTLCGVVFDPLPESL